MSERQIIRDVSRYSESDEPSHHWSLIVDGVIVSQLWVSITTGEILNVETAPGYQGCGYASDLYHRAATEIEIFHAPESHRTYAGDRFARSVGGDSLPCGYGCCPDQE